MGGDNNTQGGFGYGFDSAGRPGTGLGHEQGATTPSQQGVLIVTPSIRSTAQRDTDQWGVSAPPYPEGGLSASTGGLTSPPLVGEVNCVWGDPTEPPVDTDHPDMSYPLKVCIDHII